MKFVSLSNLTYFWGKVKEYLSTTFYTKTEADGKYATKTELGAKLDASTAESTYAKAADVARDYQTKGDYATKTELGNYVTTSDADGKYAAKTELGAKLDASTAADTYATKTELGAKLDSTTAESTYAKKADIPEAPEALSEEEINSILSGAGLTV